MEEILIVGIDGGLKGGITIMRKDGTLYEFPKDCDSSFLNVNDKLGCISMPTINANQKMYDIQAIKELFLLLKSQCKNVIVVLEMAQMRVINGIKSTATNWECYGLMKGILAMAELPYVLVDPKDWQKKILKGFVKKTKAQVENTKDASILYATSRFPSFDFRHTPKGRVKSDGKTDSLGIADYYRLVYVLGTN